MSILWIGVLWSTTIVFQQAGDYEGAATVLKRVSQTQPTAAEGDVAPRPKTDFEKLDDDIKSFAGRVKSLPHAQSADEWLLLADRVVNFKPSQADLAHGIGSFAAQQKLSGVSLLISAIPGPDAWPLLNEKIRARPIGDGVTAHRNRSLRLLAAVLVKDEAGQWEELGELEKSLAQLEDWQRHNMASTLQSLAEELAAGSDDPLRSIAGFEHHLHEAESVKDHEGLSRYEFFGTRVPDLVGMVGRERAEPLLTRAVLLPIMIEVADGEETRRLAQSIALARINDLRAPQWKLCFSTDAAPLYEALRDRFMKPRLPAGEADPAQPGADIERVMAEQRRGIDEHEREQAYSGARFHYFMHLIAAGRLDDARALASELKEGENWVFYHMYGNSGRDYTAIGAIKRSPHAARAAEFLCSLLEGNPKLPLWKACSNLCFNRGEFDRFIAVAQKAAADESLSQELRRAVTTELKSALLSADRIDDAIEFIRHQLDDDTDRTQMLPRSYDVVELMRIAHATGRDDVLNEALARGQSIGNDERDSFDNVLRPVVKILLAVGRGPDAERLVADALVRAVKVDPKAPGHVRRVNPRALLVLLATIYHHAGRYADVIALAEHAPWWGVRDLADQQLDREQDLDYSSGGRDTPLPITFIIGDSLAHTDRRDEARAILHYLVLQSLGSTSYSSAAFDPAYESLATMDGDALLPLLEDWAKRDPFEERPLIWTAHLLRTTGRLDEAMTVIQQAIAIDPSDGEQAPPRRMRAYQVLGDIAADQGDVKTAAQMRTIIEAIRLSEQADEVNQIGLHSRAIDMYKQALAMFADAYCIQSRIAVQLASVGRHEEAAAHYRRAFELMPDSFGRMESHCFGCEGVFLEGPAIGIAEQVFTKMTQDRPQDAKPHYLLGYLHEQQERFDMALASFKRAVEIDPSYLNAWTHISRLRQSMRVPVALTDEAALNTFRLRPSMAGLWSLSTVRDLRKLWSATTGIQIPAVEPPETMLAFTASAIQLDKLEAAKAEAGRSNTDRWDSFGDGSVIRMTNAPSPNTPGEFLARQGTVAAICATFSSFQAPQ